MTGLVRSVPVEAGAEVAKGDILVVLEAMKMEHSLRAAADGVVEAVHCAVGDTVERRHAARRVRAERRGGAAEGEESLV